MNVREYLKQDRQWPRVHRINHAKWQLSQAKTPHDKQFWESVLEANTDD